MELKLADFSRGRHALHYAYAVGEHRFSTSFWYSDVDFERLEACYTPEQLRLVYLHIGAFEMCKLSSLNPTSVSFGPFADLVDEPFAQLWQRLIVGIWAQWRYQNDLPYWQPPVAIVGPTAGEAPRPMTVDPGAAAYLAFCGGGKDTAITHELLDRAGATGGSLVYAHSAYGRAERQFELTDALLDVLPDGRRHRLTVCDTFLEAPLPLVQAEFGIASVTAAETPASIFASVPIALQHGYTHLVLGHEKSADAGNLVWAETGEDVNHQWGKSREAEGILADYLRSHLVTNLHFFSILKPVHDVVIFGALADLPPQIIHAAHSCNTAKPWCKRCAKCVYVWLSYLAYLDEPLVRSVFQEDLFDVDDNVPIIRALLGRDGTIPFECIGHGAESRLALALCRARGVRGRHLHAAEFGEVAVDAASISHYTHVDVTYPLPPELADAVFGDLQRSGARTRDWVLRTLGLDAYHLANALTQS